MAQEVAWVIPRAARHRSGIRAGTRFPDSGDVVMTPVRWPVSRVLSRDAGMVIHLGRRLPDASCSRPEGGATHPCAACATRALLFGLAPGRACPFHPARPKPMPTRLCGAGPRLAADGSYPLPCVVVLGLSSGDGSPRHTRPSGHLTSRWTVAPLRQRLARPVRRGSWPRGEPRRPDRRGPDWPARRPPCWWREARAWRSIDRTWRAAPWPRSRARASWHP